MKNHSDRSVSRSLDEYDNGVGIVIDQLELGGQAVFPRPIYYMVSIFFQLSIP